MKNSIESNNNDNSDSQNESDKSLYKTFKKLFIRHAKKLEQYEDPDQDDKS